MARGAALAFRRDLQVAAVMASLACDGGVPGLQAQARMRRAFHLQLLPRILDMAALAAATEPPLVRIFVTIRAGLEGQWLVLGRFAVALRAGDLPVLAAQVEAGLVVIEGIEIQVVPVQRVM